MSYRYGPDRYKDGSLVNHWVEEPAANTPPREMVERVARAMVLSWGGDPDTTETASSSAPRPKMWELYADQAHAAIEAMREPTEAMMKAAARPWLDDDEGELFDRNTLKTWQDMIDEALK